MALTQECILSFLLERGGKVRNSELLNTFRSQISCGDPAEKQHNRDLFKKLVNSVAVVKQVDGVKFVAVKKRYQDFVRDVAHRPRADDSFSSPNSSLSCSSPRSAGVIYSDIENNNVCHPHDASAGGVQERRPLSRSISADATTVKVLNISADQASRARKSGAVFAVIAVKSPPRETALVPQEGPQAQVHHQEAPNKPKPLVAKVTSLKSCSKGAPGDPQCWKSSQTEEVQPPGLPQVRPQIKTTKQGDDPKYSESVPLEPLAHEWLVKCAAGLWGQIYGLLLQDTRLAQKKDFMSGFTALHWAAKDGNKEMMHKLVEVSRKRGTCVDVNVKAHGGYTPLHIAAIHSRTEVMVLLVQRYGASVTERDNDGKKASHYLGPDVPDEVRALLGGLQQDRGREKTGEDGQYREHPKGFNTISKLFQPHMGKKQKTKFAHDCCLLIHDFEFGLLSLFMMVKQMLMSASLAYFRAAVLLLLLARSCPSVSSSPAASGALRSLGGLSHPYDSIFSPLLKALSEHGASRWIPGLRKRMKPEHRYIKYLTEVYTKSSRVQRSLDGTEVCNTVRLIKPQDECLSAQRNTESFTQDLSYSLDQVRRKEQLLKSALLYNFDHERTAPVNSVCHLSIKEQERSNQCQLCPGVHHTVNFTTSIDGRSWVEVDVTLFLQPLLKFQKRNLHLLINVTCPEEQRVGGGDRSKGPLKFTLRSPPLLLYLNDTSKIAHKRLLVGAKTGQTPPTVANTFHKQMVFKPEQRTGRKRRWRRESSKSKRGDKSLDIHLPELLPSTEFPTSDCALYDFRVRFSQLKLDHWIVFPPKYNPRYCRGICPRTMGFIYGSPVHTMVQNIIYEKLDSSMPRPSCIPSHYNPLSVMIFEEDGSYVYKEFEDMVATSHDRWSIENSDQAQ
ncbi:hypothetical protein L3Q82_005781 [Scortum barcoo]|uniref:Uncharacterized protein n=1 Tax=Scortum barcoo TaxID=214431 RepID=A0ACB8V6N6_9TELE|nr:hypothetical protein L3Q82_005781 [Scortum barcoo]